ncbi:MAG: hypothetical protein WEB00_11265 [Dehalococcoidia bacterium]
MRSKTIRRPLLFAPLMLAMAVAGALVPARSTEAGGFVVDGTGDAEVPRTVRLAPLLEPDAAPHSKSGGLAV